MLSAYFWALQNVNLPFHLLETDNLQLTPKTIQLPSSDSTTTLIDNLTIPSSVVVDINDAVSTSSQTVTNKLIVQARVVWIEGTTEIIVDKPLPGDRKTEGVDADGAEMLHLAYAIWVAEVCQGWVCAGDGTVTVDVAAKVEACNVDAGCGRS